MKPHQVARHSHHYIRHGITSLFAALEVGTSNVNGGWYDRHRHQEFLDFLKLAAMDYPRKQLQLVVDNASSHQTPEVAAWLEKNRRIHLHFTPTGSSRINQVETWFSIISRTAIRRGVFKSLGALIDAIQRLLDAWNENSKPFVWVKSAEQILGRIDSQRFKMTAH
jgi:transposase